VTIQPRCLLQYPYQTRTMSAYVDLKETNLKFALITMTLGTVVLLISITPVPSPLPCLLTQDACAATFQQEALQNFIAWFSMGTILMAIAVAFLFLGRDKPRASASSSTSNLATCLLGGVGFVIS
jgi:hypothetical protein